MDEFSALYPEISYFIQAEYTAEMLKNNKSAVLRRNGINEESAEDVDSFRQNLNIGAIFVWCWITAEALSI